MNTQILHYYKLVFVFVSLWASLQAVVAQLQDFTVEPVPAWADASVVREHDNPLEKESVSGAFCLLFDVEINGGTRERFIHIANKFLTSSGVEANSHLSFSFDPSYQKLVLHKIVIHRGTEVLDQLDPGKIRMIQQEKDLDRLIYNGAKTALLFLEDVHVGDWVEYAYTIRGRNPIENGHFYDSLQLRWSFPIQTENYRLIWPQTNQALWVQIHGDAPKNRKATDEFYEYYWHWENRAGKEMEEFVPAITVPYTFVHFSDFQTWTEVANWAEKSFQYETVSAVLKQKAMAWRDEKLTDEQRVVKALQFVQDDIRYLGIENGVNSHQPTDPSVVIARGYGDCKDKALLFCTLLRFFDINALPVLVSSTYRQAVNSFIPTPLIFDHVIVQVVIHGKTNFIDTTRSFQRGPLERRFVEHFFTGLPLKVGSPGLIAIPIATASSPQSIVDELFDVSANGATKLAATNIFKGRDADFVRQRIASVSGESLKKDLLLFYQKYYADIVATRAPVVHDDTELNSIEIIGGYFIKNIWKPAAQTNFITCEFVSPEIMRRLYVPVKKERKSALAILCPENISRRIQIETHEPFNITPKVKEIKTKAFHFFSKTELTNNRVTIINQLSTFNPGIAAADFPEYMAAVEQIPRFLGLAFTKPIPGKTQDGSPNWSIWMGAFFYSIILLIAATLIYRYKPKSPPEISPPGDAEPKGLGGWLAFFGIALILAVPQLIYSLLRISSVYSVASWSAITDPANSSYDALIAPLLLFELFTQLTLIMLAILLVVFYFQKRRIFPILVMIYLSLQFFTTAADQVMLSTRKSKVTTTNISQKTGSAIGRSLTPLILWGLYFSRSKRVKNTFLN